MSQIKKIAPNKYEIDIGKYLIYISQEKNPNTENLFLYFVDVFDLTSITSMDSEPCDSEVFDELNQAKDYIKWNYNLSDSLLNKIKMVYMDFCTLMERK